MVDSRMILGEYTKGMSSEQSRWFQFELSDVEQMYSNGEIAEEKFREMCSTLRDGYMSGALPLDETDD